MPEFDAKKILLVILAIAFFLRIWNAWNQDIFGDEASDAFRSIGYVDYLGTNFQTQPIDWYKDKPLPFWTKLSFHDFPPMAMIVQHAFFRIFGDSILIARLPAIIMGTLSVLLIYLIARKLFVSEILALLSSFILAVNGAMVWISRTALLEPILLFFLLLDVYFFLKFLQSKRYWWLFGVGLGFVALTKYTGIFVIPIYFFYILFFRREVFKNWRLYCSLAIALLMFSPVIVYNFYLYKTTGHFDLQIAYFLDQKTPEWTGLVGKTQSPFSDIAGNLVELYGWPFLIAVFLGFSSTIYKSFRVGKAEKADVFLWLYLVFAILLLTKIGSANRFLSLLGPLFALFTAIILEKMLAGFSWKNPLALTAAAFLIFEIGYSINKNIITMADYGIAKLDHYFEEEFRGKESAVIPESDNQHLNEIIYKFAKRKSENSPRAFNLIIYNDNLVLPTIEWIFFRRFFYHNIPTLFIENFSKALKVQGQDYFKPFTIYFAQSADIALLNPNKLTKTIGAEFEKLLQDKGISISRIIYGHDNLPMFRIYKFSL